MTANNTITRTLAINAIERMKAEAKASGIYNQDMILEFISKSIEHEKPMLQSLSILAHALADELDPEVAEKAIKAKVDQASKAAGIQQRQSQMHQDSLVKAIQGKALEESKLAKSDPRFHASIDLEKAMGSGDLAKAGVTFGTPRGGR